MTSEKRILIAEDDTSAREAWCELAASWGFKSQGAEDGQRALELIDSYSPRILLLDLKMPRKGGIAVLEEISRRGANVATIIISGQGDVADVVRCIKLGAYDYLQKPIDPPHMQAALNNLCAHLDVREENSRLRERLARVGELGSLTGRSPAMKRVIAMIEQAAPTTASIVIRGESGTGKELAARTIHELSSRRSGPYIAINCAALPESLMESELFGHERGAFTGAERRREGCFELANGGTLLLDEITEMKVELQAKLLRVLEERKLRRLGGTAEIQLDVRILATTNRDPEELLREGKLREDLYYRLNVFTIEMPSLRARTEDIPILVEHFLRELAPANGKELNGVDNECLEALRECNWPGNVRQLRNVIERALIVARGSLISTADLPPDLRQDGNLTGNFELRVGSSLDAVERELIRKTMDFVAGDKVRAAGILGISLKTLYNRLERYRSESNVNNE